MKNIAILDNHTRRNLLWNLKKWWRLNLKKWWWLNLKKWWRLNLKMRWRWNMKMLRRGVDLLTSPD